MVLRAGCRYDLHLWAAPPRGVYVRTCAANSRHRYFSALQAACVHIPFARRPFSVFMCIVKSNAIMFVPVLETLQ